MKYLFFLALAVTVHAQTPRDTSDQFSRMAASVTRVLCAEQDELGTGTGFFVGDGHHIVTNWHVADCIENNGKIGILDANGDVKQAEVTWHSPAKDLAVLEVMNVQGRPVSFETGAGVRNGEHVYAVGFPGAADRGMGRGAALQPKFSAGIVSSAIVEDDNGRKLLQTDAAINPGNSGGPLFNDCGQVIAINDLKSLTAVRVVDPNGGSHVERVPLGEGIGWAIRTEELLPELTSLGLKAPATTAACTPGLAAGTDWVTRGMLALAIMLSGTAMLLGLTRQGRAVVRRTLSIKPGGSPLSPPAPVAAPAPSGSPVLRGLGADFANLTINLGPKGVTMGRDPQRCNLVFPPAAEGVSKWHCVLRWDSGRHAFIVEDLGSMNGTFTAKGERIPTGQPRSLQPGEQFYVGNRRNLFEVALQ